MAKNNPLKTKAEMKSNKRFKRGTLASTEEINVFVVWLSRLAPSARVVFPADRNAVQ